MQAHKFFGILFGVFVMGVLLGVFLVDTGYMPATHGVSASGEDIAVDISVDYGNGDVQSFAQEMLREGDSVLGLLDTLEVRHGIATERRNFPGMGVFIEAIHGVRNSNNFYWQYWVNGAYAQVAAEQYILQDGDNVLWKRTDELQ
jgi:hypothetical protein